MSALEHYDRNEFDAALLTFDTIADTSKILFNCGVIHATLGEHEKAVCYLLLQHNVHNLTTLGRLLSARRASGSISRSCILPARRLQLSPRGLRGGTG